MDVGSWLRSLGLGQYEANFRDNKIDADVLPQLTADDLKDIGVSASPDRSEIARATRLKTFVRRLTVAEAKLAARLASGVGIDTAATSVE